MQETILLRDNGTKIKISVARNGIHWRFDVYYCLPKKRTWHSVHSTDDWQWRRLDLHARCVYKRNKELEYVTNEELLAAAILVWEREKPTLDNII